MDEILAQDIITRGRLLYAQFQNIIQVVKPEKWYKSEFEFVINDDIEINGLSSSENNKDYIQINSGVIDLYYKYFSAVIKHDSISFLQTIMPDKEMDEIEKISYEALIFKNGNVDVFDNKIVDDKKARLLEIFVSRFITLHELGHILNGHCKLLAKLSQKETYFMSMYYIDKNMESNEKEALDIRTMEMDADAFAATQSMNHLLYLYDNFETEVDLANMSKQELFYWWAFAIRSHFLVCEDRFADSKYNPKMKHLPSVARWTLVYNSIISLLDYFNKSQQEIQSFKNNIYRGTIDAEIKFNNIKFTNYNWIKEIYSDKEYKKYIDEINDNWSKVKMQLEEYARLPLFQEN